MEQTTHDGTVLTVQPGLVKVQMQVLSACAACEAHARCTFSEKKDKIVDIETAQWQQYHEGDPVTVIINSAHGLLAVLLAYILPAVVILATFALLFSLHLSELWVALITLVAVALYGGILYLCRNRLQQKFTFRLAKRG